MCVCVSVSVCLCLNIVPKPESGILEVAKPFQSQTGRRFKILKIPVLSKGGATYSLHCSSFLGLPYRILIIYLVKPKKELQWRL